MKERDFYPYHEKNVIVTLDDESISGMCYLISEIEAQEDYEMDEAQLEIGSWLIPISMVRSIRLA